MSATAPGRRRLRRREIIAYVIALAVVAAGSRFGVRGFGRYPPPA